MELIDVMFNRRSSRKFTDKPITKVELDKILQAALLAPTSMNRKPCNFLVVERQETLKQLANSKNHGAELLEGANKAIVVLANASVADTWCEDSSIALTYMHLMATDLGLGSCWVQIHLRDKEGADAEEVVRDIVGVDSYYRVVGIMALGNIEKQPAPHIPEDLDKSKIHFLV